MDEFEQILTRIQTHFTVGEFLDFLSVEWDVLLDNTLLLEIIEERLEDIKEEIGIE